MNFEELLSEIKELIIKNKDELPIENAGIMNITFSTFTTLEGETNEITKFIINFCQYQDESFHIEGGNLITSVIAENGNIIRSEIEDIKMD
ncbi:MAG: hypothetical protein WC188_03945 [Candidatus Caldatribacteriota bacterium]|nr:hypothetical protein [Patescibacteria group bacterium]